MAEAQERLGPQAGCVHVYDGRAGNFSPAPSLKNCLHEEKANSSEYY